MVKKAFISYARTDDNHIDRIKKIGASLMEDHGIEVILDLWDCKEGDDLNVFMERIVNDESVDYVIIVSDDNYRERANGRKGGVGKESTIISSKIYKVMEDSKFIPIFTNIQNEEPSLPTFCNTRNSIDMTNIEYDYEKIEEIARRVHNKPKHKKPKLGTVPDYDNNQTQLNTLVSKMQSSKPYNILDNFHGIFDFIMKSVIEIDDQEKIITDNSFFKIKPYIEAWEKTINFVIHSDIDVSLIIIEYYNDFLSELHNEHTRPLSRLFLYFTFLEITFILISNQKFDILKSLIFGTYRFLGRESQFYQLSLYPRKIQTFLDYENINIRKHVGKLLYDGKKFSTLVEIDILLNTISLINPYFEGSFIRWHGTLRMKNFMEIYNHRSNVIVDKFRSKTYFNKFKDLFGTELDQFKIKLEEMKSHKQGELMIISDLIKVDNIGEY